MNCYKFFVLVCDIVDGFKVDLIIGRYFNFNGKLYVLRVFLKIGI